MSLTPAASSPRSTPAPPAPVPAAPLRVEQALRLLPDVEDLAPLRGCVFSLTSSRSSQTWKGAEPNRTVGKRSLDPTALRLRVPQVLNRVTGRIAFLYDAAVDAIESERRGDLSQAVRALMRAGQFEETDIRYDQAHAWYRQALGLAEQLRDRQPEMEALCLLGRLEATRGYLDNGARAFQRSLALAEAESDRAYAAAACKGLGDVLFAQAQWAGAEAWFARGLQYAEGNPSLAGTLSLAVGQTAHRRGEYAAAAERLQQALQTFEAQGDTAGVVRTLLARGLMQAAQGKTSEALATYREALARLPETESDPGLELTVRLRLAELYLEVGRLPAAEDELRRAEDVAVEHQQQRWLARVYLLLGKLRGRHGDENGFVFFEQAIELCRSGEPALRLEADVYREYARFRMIMGDDAEARAYLERARELLEPFGDAAAREKIDEELQRLSE